MEGMGLIAGILLLLNLFLQMIILNRENRALHMLKEQMNQMQNLLGDVQTKLEGVMELKNSSRQETVPEEVQPELSMRENSEKAQVNLSQEDEALINEVLSEVFT